MISSDPRTEQLAQDIHATEGGGDPVSSVLTTDERVLARVTDGIYRQPGSALRELVANAYDADATQVVITTDRPRFERIRVEDDGIGMKPEVLAYLLTHIGGSAKRISKGIDLGITNTDPLFSPGGRRLIGKVGIGLFSVSQLTQSFHIITKVVDDPYRTIASVTLKHYSDRGGQQSDEDYEAGIVKVWREPATDVDAHGTSIVLTRVRPQTKQTLSSDQIWTAIEQNEALADPDERQDIQPPTYHIGRLIPGQDEKLRHIGMSENVEQVPWAKSDEPRVAFAKLVDAVWDQVHTNIRNPQLSQVFDEYLQMIWRLSLSVPLPYVGGHPFDLPIGTAAATYLIPDDRDLSLERLQMAAGETFRERLDLRAGSDDASFRLLVDDIELTRPLRFQDLPNTHNVLRHPVIAVGSCYEPFDGVDSRLSAGPLAFEAYFMWNSKIAPVEHQGVLVRIFEASGTLFDTTFMRYEGAEQTRLRQTTCEVFVSEGLESALNIDRESFNFAHPHVVYLTNWVHTAIRRLHTTQKALAKGARDRKRTEQSAAAEEELDDIVAESWSQATGDEDLIPPDVVFSRGDRPQTEAEGESYAFRRENVFDGAERSTGRSRIVERQMIAIAKVLSAYDVFDGLGQNQQEALLRSIRRILEVE